MKPSAPELPVAYEVQDINSQPVQYSGYQPPTPLPQYPVLQPTRLPEYSVPYYVYTERHHNSNLEDDLCVLASLCCCLWCFFR